MNFRMQKFPEMSDKEYQELIQTVKQKDLNLYKEVTDYVRFKLNQFLSIFPDHQEEHDYWESLTISQKVQTLTLCLECDFSLLEFTDQQRQEILPDLVRILAESLRRKFTKEDKVKEEIIVDPEYQELLEEALKAIESK